MFTMTIITRSRSTTAKAAVESFLRELTAKIDITATFDQNESWGQFQYWDIVTSMNRYDVHRAAREILNNFEGDDNAPWWAAGHHPRKIRHHEIVRISVC